MTDKSNHIKVANEFAQVTIQKVATSKGERLEINAPKLDEKIRLDAMALESLTYQDQTVFSEFLTRPFGGD